MANPRTIARIEAQIQRRAAHCLQFELSDPRSHFITITKVELASDLVSGKIYYSVLGDDAERTQVKSMLDGAAGFIQRQVASVLRMRNMPHLSWMYDSSIADSVKMDQLISSAIERDHEINPELPPIEPAGQQDDGSSDSPGESAPLEGEEDA